MKERKLYWYFTWLP